MEWINDNIALILAAAGVTVPAAVVFGAVVIEKATGFAAEKTIGWLYAKGDDDVDLVIEANVHLLAKKIPDEIKHDHPWIRKLVGGKVWRARLVAAGLRGLDKAATKASIPKE